MMEFMHSTWFFPCCLVGLIVLSIVFRLAGMRPNGAGNYTPERPREDPFLNSDGTTSIDGNDHGTYQQMRHDLHMD